MVIVGTLYVVLSVLLALYGFNTFVLVCLYLRHRTDRLLLPCLERYPPVTVQLPLFNEVYVAERLINAAAKLEYPKDRLQIQVLDDSTDDTVQIARKRVEAYRAKGLDIELTHRKIRVDFKAGALRQALEAATGQFIAIFDADFVPQSGFLLETIPYFLANPRLGFVQTRWSHLNDCQSPLTRAQAIALDGHFVVEQTARQRSGLFMNFNGTAGVWRKKCVEDAGGWQGDTLSEDMDLSYRAQLRGWEPLYLPGVPSPAEIPPQIQAFKRQQYRWAKGSIQCALKLARDILSSPVSAFKKAQGLLHLTNYSVHPLMVALLLLILPLIVLGQPFQLPLAYLSLASLGPPLLYLLAQKALYPNWVRRFAYFPVLALLGTGIALSNTLAIAEALLGRKGDFRRTPKFGLGEEKEWRDKRYALPMERVVYGEFALAMYALATTALAWHGGHYYAVPFLLIYTFGFGYASLLTAIQSAPRWPKPYAEVSPALMIQE